MIFLPGNTANNRRGFTMVEMVVVIGILGVLASLVLPALFSARLAARKMQCTSQMRQISQALVMYDIDHDRVFENYPDRVTHLVDLGYAADARVFVCPMDWTKATKDGNNKTTLKPGAARDNKDYWAERITKTDPCDTPLMHQKSSSYLYEFSTRSCQAYIGSGTDTAPYEWSGSGFGIDALVTWYGADDDTYWFGPDAYSDPVDTLASFNYQVMSPANPRFVDRNGDGIVTWQEAKFYQLAEGDVYTIGYAWPGEMYVPTTWLWAPSDQISAAEAYPMHGYPRTWMPILRCFWHMDAKRVDDEMLEEVLNLAIDGNTFYSAPGWEQTAWKYGRVSNPITE